MAELLGTRNHILKINVIPFGVYWLNLLKNDRKRYWVTREYCRNILGNGETKIPSPGSPC